MSRCRLRLLLTILLAGCCACVKVYAPPQDPITEERLSDAIETLRGVGDDVVVLEDGFQLEAYVYVWEAVPPPLDIPLSEQLLWDAGFSEGHRVQRLSGPPVSVYLPYNAILSVEARSWPMWSGVELAVAGRDARIPDSPLVIRVKDPQEAERLADAIDFLRRARQPEGGETRAPDAGD